MSSRRKRKRPTARQRMAAKNAGVKDPMRLMAYITCDECFKTLPIPEGFSQFYPMTTCPSCNKLQNVWNKLDNSRANAIDYLLSLETMRQKKLDKIKLINQIIGEPK